MASFEGAKLGWCRSKVHTRAKRLQKVEGKIQPPAKARFLSFGKVSSNCSYCLLVHAHDDDDDAPLFLLKNDDALPCAVDDADCDDHYHSLVFHLITMMMFCFVLLLCS